MTVRDEGIIKFKYQLVRTKEIAEENYIDLEKWRVILFKMNFIGEYPVEKLGYGNLSKRSNPKENSFIITGSQTGCFPNLDGTQYTHVTKCDLKKMLIEAKGPIIPSSESTTHYAIYESCPHVQAVFHIHHHEFWKYLLNNNFDQIPANINYGSQEMAMATAKCIAQKKQGLFAMAGHEDGIVSYGETVEEAGKILLDVFKQSKN